MDASIFEFNFVCRAATVGCGVVSDCIRVTMLLHARPVGCGVCGVVFAVLACLASNAVLVLLVG